MPLSIMGQTSKQLPPMPITPGSTPPRSPAVSKEDATFNSVGQSHRGTATIPSSQNTRQEQRTSERIILGQWSSDISEIGNQAGGTGTLRETRIIGQDVQIPVLAFAGLGTPSNSATAYCSDCTVTSSINDTCAGSGSGAYALRINGGWVCKL